METRDTNEALSLPNQMVSSATKSTKKWQKDTLEYYINYAKSDKKFRKNKSQFKRNEDMYDSIVNIEEMSDTYDPLGINRDMEKYDDIATKAKFYNIVKKPVRRLVNEEAKRRADIKAIALNQEVINEKDLMYRKKVMDYLGQLQANYEQYNIENIEKELAEIDRWGSQDLQSSHEQMANEILTALKQDSSITIDHTLNKAFANLIKVGEDILRIGSIGDQPALFNVDSKNFYVYGLTKTGKVEDAFAWVEEEYLTPYQIINEFNLENSDVKRLFSLYNEAISDAPEFVKAGQLVDGTYIEGQGLETLMTAKGDVLDLEGDDNSFVDEYGNIKIYRVHFLSLRKVKKVITYDEKGDEVTEYHDENYEVDDDTQVETEWINEVWQGIKIGEDIYHDVKPCDIQMRSMLSPKKVKPPYVGEIIKKSLIDDIAAYQEMFNLWMNKLTTLWVQNLGKVAVIDVSRIPSDMSTDEWFMWLKNFKLVFENPFEESKKRPGQLAGNMQQNSKEIDLSLAQEINQAVIMLNWIKQEIDDITGISPQRQGDIGSRDGLGTTQQAIVQSATLTSDWFDIHDRVKVQAFTYLLEYTKVLWKDKKEKRQYLLSDLSNHIIDVDGELLNEAEFGIQITNNSRLYDLENQIMQLGHAAMQSGSITLADFISVTLSNSSAEMISRLQSAEAKRIKQSQEIEKQKQEAQMQMQQMSLQFEERKHQMELEKIKLEMEYKIQIEQLKLLAVQDKQGRDDNMNWVEDQAEIDMTKLTVASQKQINDDKLAFEREKLNKQMIVDNKKLELEAKKIEVDKIKAKQTKTLSKK